MSNPGSVGEVEAVEFSNRLAEEVVSNIVAGTLERGGAASDILIVCENVVIGLIFACLKLYGATEAPEAPERLLVALTARLKERLVEIAREEGARTQDRH